MPKRHLDEREALEQWLEYHRNTLLWKCSGLTAEQLKQRAVPPSELSLLGLVRHLTEVERWWFRVHAADQDVAVPYSSRDDRNADFDRVDEADARADLEAFREEIEECRKAVRDKDLDEVVRTHGRDPREPADIRWIFLHMIEEYARHNGHADLMRERIDGATGD
jgi:uncharacterized damage-inducible protein DinB